MKFISNTFRIRLAAWNAAVVILTAVITLAVLRQGVRWAILHEMDQILRDDVREIVLAIDELDRPEFPALREALERKAVGHRHHEWFVQLLDSDGRIIWASASPVGTDVSAAKSNSNAPYTFAGYRIARQTIPASQHGIAAIQVGSSLRFLRADMARIDRTVILAAGIVLLLAPVVGYWLASRTIQPVSHVIRTAERLRPSRMEERLPIRGTGDELDRLAQTINGLLDRIAIYVQERRDFLANAAHELRTPLAAIRSSIEVALNSKRSSEEYENLLVEIIDQSACLETLVNQLLLISEAEMGSERLKSEFKRVPLDDVIGRSIAMFRGVAESYDVALETTLRPGVQVLGSRHLLRQLVNNLIDNAVKYTPAGGRVRVECDVAKEGNRPGIRLSVIDNGPGIAPADLGRVFERFYRADKSRARLQETVGTGLGLSICQAVVTAHGGTIDCRSTLGEGTQIDVWLPEVPPSAASDEGDLSSARLVPDSSSDPLHASS